MKEHDKIQKKIREEDEKAHVDIVFERDMNN
jgi:hypothetical protein